MRAWSVPLILCCMPNSTAPIPNLLIVDDDEAIQRLLVMAAQDMGWRPVSVGSGVEAIAQLRPGLEAVVLDHHLPGMNGLETLAGIRSSFPSLPVIMLTGNHDAETAVRAMRAGADDYITKPFELKRLFGLLSQARNTRRDAAPTLVRTPPSRHAASKIRSGNAELSRLLGQLEKAARLDSTILLTGESGTGKTHFAREIHRLSPRAAQDFVAVSCPALPKDLLESELFGHERGAFTGATASRAGRFEQAHGGTLFLDEIGDLPASLQPKLLTVLQDREFFRVGGNKLLQTDARVIAATNVHLPERVALGHFREDLYYRLNIIELHIPPLRERKEDIPALAMDFLARIASKRGREGWVLTPEAVEALVECAWPGNIRQLQNVLERASAFADGSRLERNDILPLIRDAGGEFPTMGKVPTLHEAERKAFIAAYTASGRNKARTARELGVSERTVYNLLARHGLR